MPMRASGFIGSPTIRIDGVDVEGSEAEQKGYGYGCRVYGDNGKIAGWPSVEKIRGALVERKQAYFVRCFYRFGLDAGLSVYIAGMSST